MLRLGGLAATVDEATAKVRAALASGTGLELFRRMVERQGGDPRVVDDPARLPAAPRRGVVVAVRPGYVAALDAEGIGRAAVALGAGRDRAEDAVDPAVGAVVHARVGDTVKAGDALVELHYRDAARVSAARDLVRAACVIADEPPATGPLVLEVIEGQTPAHG